MKRSDQIRTQAARTKRQFDEAQREAARAAEKAAELSREMENLQRELQDAMRQEMDELHGAAESPKSDAGGASQKKGSKWW
jgi:hypothetical protein